jgi:hypothetical protein
MAKLEEDQRRILEAMAGLAAVQKTQQAKLKLHGEEFCDFHTVSNVFKEFEARHTSNLQTTNSRLEEVTASVHTLTERQDNLLKHINEISQTVRALQEQQEEAKASVEARHKNYKEMEVKMAALVQPGAAPPASHESAQAFHLSGVHALRHSLREKIGEKADPIRVVRRLLREVGVDSFMTRIQLIDARSKEDRLGVRSVIVHMTSPFHKNTALVKIKTLLYDLGLEGVYVEDCFPASKMEEVRLLKYYGGKLRKEGKVTKYRVVNRMGQPVLQTGEKKNTRYTDTQLPSTFTRADMERETADRSKKTRPPPPAERRQPQSGQPSAGGSGRAREDERDGGHRGPERSDRQRQQQHSNRPGSPGSSNGRSEQQRKKLLDMAGYQRETWSASSHNKARNAC